MYPIFISIELYLFFQIVDDDDHEDDSSEEENLREEDIFGK